MKTIILASFWLLLIPGLCSIALAQPTTRIEQVYPAIVMPGNWVDISGAYLGNRRGTRKVFIARYGDNFPPLFFWLDDMYVNWASDSLVQVAIPSDLWPGDYLLKIENDYSQSRGRSNMLMVRVLDPSTNVWPDASMLPVWRSTVIDNLSRDGIDGDIYLIQGRNVGFCSNVTLQGDPVQQFMPRPLEVLSCDDSRIRVRIPAGLPQGTYLVQVNNDASWIWGSNSMRLSVPPPAPRANFTREKPDLVVSEHYVTRLVQVQGPIDFPIQGQPALVTITVLNRGAGPAGPFTVQWFASEFSANPTMTWSVPGLQAHQAFPLTYVYPGYPTWHGRIWPRVFVDAFDEVEESNERNNVDRKPIKVVRP